MKFLSCFRSRSAVMFALFTFATSTTTAQKVTVINMIPRSSSNETNQDSEPNLAVNPANPSQMAGSAFTPNPPGVPAGTSPIYLSGDGGTTWTLSSIIPGSNHDITLRFGGLSNTLYVSWIDGQFIYLDTEILRVTPFPTPQNLTVLQDLKKECIFGFCDVIDQPYVEATTVTAGSGSGSDRVYIGENDIGKAGGNGDTASLNQSLDAATAAPPAGFNSLYVDARPTCGQDAPSVRAAVHSSGVVYAAFMHESQCSSLPITSDLVVVRDDNWGASTVPYSDLKGTDTNPGVAIVTGISSQFTRDCIGSTGPACMGTERLGSPISIAVDPNNAGNVWVAWADGTDAPNYTLHVRFSNDKGLTWHGDVRTVTPATNPALAVNSKGVVGFLYQKFVAHGDCLRPKNDNGTSCWETHLETSSVGSTWSDLKLANTPDEPAQFNPSLGDYIHLMSVDKTLYGIFSANNFPAMSNFPQRVIYQRNVDFMTNRLLDVNSAAEVSISVDPFFFSIVPDPCQSMVDNIQALQDQMDELDNLLGDPGISQAAQQRIRATIRGLAKLMANEKAQLQQCELQHQ